MTTILKQNVYIYIYIYIQQKNIYVFSFIIKKFIVIRSINWFYKCFNFVYIYVNVKN